jgi:4'-phosphopantetheinyl transferase
MNYCLHWLTRTLNQLPEHEDWLSEGERKRLAQMRFAKRRNDWKLGRWTAKQAICGYLKEAPPPLAAIEILSAEDGAPEVFLDGSPAPFSLSISHSHQKSLCAIAPRDFAIGCDLELIEPHPDNFFEDYFTAEEISLPTVAPAPRDLVLFLIWSAKESCLKILREGLRRDTRSVTIHPDFRAPGEQWNTWTGRCMESSRVFHGWWRSRRDYVYTMASDQPNSSPEELK